MAAATAEDVDMAVDAARTAFFRNEGKDWSSASGAYRAKFLRAISDMVYINLMIIIVKIQSSSAIFFFLDLLLLPISMQILERKSLLAKLETIDTGKPLDEAISDMVYTLVQSLLYIRVCLIYQIFSKLVGLIMSNSGKLCFLLQVLCRACRSTGFEAKNYCVYTAAVIQDPCP